MFEFEIEEPRRTEEPLDVNFERAVEAAGVSSFWSEFYDEPRPYPLGAVVAVATLAAAVSVGLWLWSRKKG